MKCSAVAFVLVIEFLVLPRTAAIHAASVPYSVADLGDLPGGGHSSAAWAINAGAQVAGASEATGGGRAFLWQDGVMTDLGVLTIGHDFSSANDINDAGDTVGQSMTWGVGLSSRAFLYSGGIMIDLGSFGGGYAIADGINNVGEIVGISRYSNGVTHAFLYSGGGMIDLGNLEGTAYGYSRAYAINDTSQIVGVSTLAGADRGFIWEGGTMTDLGDLPGAPETTRAYDINSLRQVAGESAVSSSPAGHAFLWEDGVMTDLNVLPGTDSSYALGINDSGFVVGASYVGPAGSASGHRAFIWDSVNGIQDLNDMLDSSGVHWTLCAAVEVNNSGQIAGWGINPDGLQHGFLLTPIPEPSTLALLGIGALALTVGWWRRRRVA